MSRKLRVTNGESRGRAGCWTCKEKHVRCTGEQPRCARCARLDLSCSYELKLLWQEDAILRGICLGREGRGLRNGNTKKTTQRPDAFYLTPNVPPIFLNTTYRHFRRRGDDGLDPEEDNESQTQPRTDRKEIPVVPPAGHRLMGPSLTIQRLPSSPVLSKNEAYLFDYFVSSICPSCSLSQAYNPYLRYIAPMSLTYGPLLDAVIAVSANELRLVNDRRFEKESWWYKDRSLKGLRMRIASGDIGWPLVATILMLCFYDISDGCNTSWLIHLRSGLRAMQQLDCNATESEALRKFCLMYFVAHDIMGHTEGASGEASGQHSWLKDDTIEEIDPLMGCSRGLLNLIDQISKAASDATTKISKGPLTKSEVAGLTAIRNELERSLRTIKQVPPPGSDSENVSEVAEAKRITARLYLHERISTLLPPNARSASALASYKIRLIEALIEQLSPLSTSPSLLWPLFVLGNASPANEEHRRFVLERLSRMLELRNLGSVRLAKQLILDKYRSWDLELEGQMKPKGKWISLA